jgi:hypothetical protein
MTRQRITPVAVLLAAVLAMGAGIAKAQQTVRIAVDSSVQISPATEQIIVTGLSGPSRTFSSECMVLNFAAAGREPIGRTVVHINGFVAHPAQVVPQVYFSEPVATGTRLINPILVAQCVEGEDTIRVFECEIANPRNLNEALVTTPAGITLAEDHEAVVGAGTDELGIADAACVKKGQKAIKTEIISDINLEPGDRLTDFLELEVNPDTGETLYGAWLEY